MTLDAARPHEQGSRPRPVASGQAVARDEAMTIGQVVTSLASEFPGLSISKVRYLEDRGLLTPPRTPGGYRTYAPADVRRLRTILTLQRDEFLPLDVIQERLASGMAAPVGRRLTRARTGRPVDVPRQDEPTFTWGQAAELVEVDEEFLRQLADYHLVATSRGGDGALSETDLDIARMCRLLARYGVEPRNLRLLRSSAEREVALLEQVALPDLRSTHPDRRAQGQRTVQDLASLLSQLADHLLYNELRRLLQ